METEKFDLKFYHWEKTTPHKPFLRQPFGDRWDVYTWSEAGQIIRKLATGLRSLELPDKSHIGLVSKNCREWVIADLAITMAGYISVPFYPTLKADAVRELIDIGDVAALFVGKLDDWEGMKDGISQDLPIITFPPYAGSATIDRGHKWTDFINRFDPLKEDYKPSLEDIWTIVFTSGTTGTPKGVVLTYENLDSTKGLTEHNNHLKISLEGDNHFFSFLPLNHIAERVVVEQTCLSYGGQISFSESLDVFAKNLQESQPTLFFAVPRIWTKFQLGVLSKMPQEQLTAALNSPHAEAVKKKIRLSIGMDNIRGCLTGASSIPEATKEWFRKLDIPIAEGYGMTENCAICTALEATEVVPGSVGKAAYGAQIKIHPDTQEILMKAPYVMKGYYKDPIKTAEVIRDGWLHTGDQGHIDEDGNLFITGRVKDTFKTSKGQFIVPSPIEWKFGDNDNIEQICLVGLGCPQPIALAVLSEIGKSKSKEAVSLSLSETLQKANDELSNYQKVSTLVVVQENWTSENGLLTPTLKVKRNAMNKRYQDLLINWHENEQSIVWE